MKILMIIPQLSLGGAERSFANVAKEFSRSNEVRCLIFNKSSSIDYDTGSPIDSLDIQGSNSIPGKLLAFARRFQAFRSYVNAFDPEVIISYLDGANFLNAMLPSGRRRIISQRGSVFHDITVPEKLVKWRLRAMKILYKRVSAIVVLNEDIREEFRRFIDVPITVIPNFFNAGEIRKKAAVQADAPVLPNGKFRIVAVGRLAREKGYDHLLRVLGAVKREYPDRFFLCIVGDGSEKDALINIARNENLTFSEETANADVYFAGKRSNPYPYIAASDALVISSSAEGGPNVLIEAMLCRTLVISANCPGPPRFRIAPDQPVGVTHETAVYGAQGILLPNFQLPGYSHTIDCWSETISRLPSQEKMIGEMVENAAVYAGGFNRDTIFKQWERIVAP